MARAPIDVETLREVAATVGSHKEFRDYFDIAPPTVLRWKMQYNLDLPDGRHTRQDADWIWLAVLIFAIEGRLVNHTKVSLMIMR